MTDLLGNIALVIAFVLIGGVFAATEMALVTLRDSQIATIAARGRRGQKVAALARTPNVFLSAVQIGVTVAGFASAAFGATSIAPALAAVLESWGMPESAALSVATVALTLVIAYLSLVLGELVPKRLALQRNAQFAYAVTPILGGFAILVRPVIWLLSVSTNALVRLLGGDPSKTADAVSDEEFREIVATQDGLAEEEKRILDDVLSLRGRPVSSVMRPRPEVVALDATAPLAETATRARELPFSRYPVVDTSIDDIVGFIHVRDLFDAALVTPDASVQSIIRPISYYPSTARVLPALSRMRAAGDHIAVVVDEYGGTDGIVTLEDLLEEVVGEIFDEYDTDIDPAVANDSVDGRLGLPDFQELTGLELPRATSETIGGLVTELLGRLAVVGDRVDLPGASIQVTAVDRRRVSRIRVTPLAVATADTER